MKFAPRPHWIFFSSTRLLGAFLFFLAVHAAHAGIRLDDDRGRTIELRAPARRIVSLLPSLTETVCALGACDRLVGVDRYASWPASVNALPKVGSIDHAQLEAIVALKPDLVLLRARARVAEQLEQLGIKVLALDARTHADVKRVMETVALAIGRPGAGEAYWRTIDARLTAAGARVPLSWQGQRVYFEVHGVSAASESSFIGETLTRLRLVNIVPATMGTFPKMSPEFVVRANPPLIMASTFSEMTAMASRPGWSRLDAIRLGRVCTFAADRFEVMMRPGPRMDEAADEIVSCLVRLGSPAP
ncbi:helical backbone metal receptor [Variovorax sp. J22G21]|uniref:ABC transporter substrate-binding protein n=1 Tax=Variovorax fucosicus TaxID=3053517 RepID=UPI002578C4C6|nr:MULTISPECIES: helical backbone metal receptor [unclassified Variovorax]MDM0040339.1 helical backbone metal receptor [Variovorax sp. J22R193]MDM0061712.1 helical backbone metal receptor [Variovorax sp. J22G21]